jgi:hypothetical protein
MTAQLRQLGLWRIINESWEEPKLNLIVATKDADGKVVLLTAEQQMVNTKIKLDHGASCKRYLLAKEKAVGNIYAHLSPSQCALVRSYKEDPTAMWGKLLKIHSQQVPSMRFSAYKLNEAKLPKSFWGKALATANKVLNMLPSAALPPDTTPYKIIKKRKPDYTPLRVFRCRVFAHVGEDKCKSLNLHTMPYVFLGYPVDYRSWKLWDLCAKQVIILWRLHVVIHCLHLIQHLKRHGTLCTQTRVLHWLPILECNRSLAWQCAWHVCQVLLQAVSLSVIVYAVSSALSVSLPYA